MFFGLGVGLALALSGCGSVLQSNTDGGGATAEETPRSSRAGSSATPRAARATTARSAPARCAAAGRRSSAATTRRASPGRVCAAIACPAPCSRLDEASCKTRTDCRVDACPGCNGGSAFVRCAAPNDPPLGCPAIACPRAVRADDRRKDACEARPDCHSVVRRLWRTARARALGCCARFSRCADGAARAVQGAARPLCDAVTPHCEGPYVVSYSAAAATKAASRRPTAL